MKSYPITDSGWSKHIIKMLKKSDVFAGWHSDAGYSGEQPIAQIAAYHEYGGSPAPPRRAPLSLTERKQRAKWIRLFKLAYKKAVAGGDKRRALDIVGLAMSSDIKAAIRAGLSPRLAAETIRRKRGKSTPLILTGHLLNAVDYSVKNV